ncbi:Premnaspirodiene oxygenase [Dichanthelium oligosanthes]|uniref:Premnaspirodiene oxygenase n=1 Tax=Dichanthelium oligosanthes TaxID=888268 RepID=A0A1E5VXQ0_9POAL|nr:Premnaspirodiene oxygenase [Dichanthelium oligosanthes]
MAMADLPLHLLFIPLLLIAIPLLYFRRRSTRGLRLPPSPWALPVIGHIHHLAVAGALPHCAMRDLARRLGPLMLLRLGELPVLIASSADAARDIMRTNDLTFATRPIGPMAKVLLGEDSYGIVFAPYGDGWRQLRRICTMELFSARRVRSFRAVREEEVRRLLRSVAASAASASASPVNLSEMISAYVADASVRAIIGSRFRDRETFLRLLERRLKNVPAQSLPELFPSSRLAMLISSTPRLLRSQREEMMAFIDTIIQEHQENRAAGDDEDLLDVLLRIQREDELDPPLTTENIKSVIIDIFGASSETSATTLQWIMAELMRNPSVMRKAQDEVRHVLAGLEIVTEDNLSGLRYLPLVIKEALRLHPPAPLLIPRESRSPCRVLGFDVPAGVMVLVNAWAIGRDPSSWEAPEEFMPERFENSDVDFKGTDFEFIPFGAGRRMCPGIGFGLANMDLALACLLYHFDWELPDGMEPGELDMTEKLGITTRRLSDLLLVPTVRVPPFSVDFKGTDFEFIQFGAGRWMCPGIGFGLANMDLTLASLLLCHFDWALPDMTEALGITTRRLSRLVLVPSVRVPLRGE